MKSQKEGKMLTRNYRESQLDSVQNKVNQPFTVSPTSLQIIVKPQGGSITQEFTFLAKICHHTTPKVGHNGLITVTPYCQALDLIH